MAHASKEDMTGQGRKGYMGKNAKITLPWFSTYDEATIKGSTRAALALVKKLGAEGDYSSGVIELQQSYNLTELESKELLKAMRDKLWNQISSGDGSASSETVEMNEDDVVYTERSVKIKDREYKLGPILGKGGFGVVRLGGHPDKPNKRYALKFISKKHMKNNIHFVKREISCMKQVVHKNVLRLFRYGNVDYPHEDGTMDPSMLLVTEYCPNGELFDVIFYCQKGMSETLTRTYFHQLMEGIKAIHDRNVFHRDIKPQNVLLDVNFQLKICDFGLSNVYDGNELLSTKVGTRGFMAPEMMMRFSYNSAVDIFSAGVVLFNMLTGVCPFRNADPNTDKHYYRLATKDPRFWAHHKHLEKNEGVKALIEGMLAYQPADRLKQEDIEKNEWYMGDIHDKDNLAKEMVILHKQCILKKGEDAHSVDLNSFVTRAVPKIPVIVPSDHAQYLTNFHTYEIHFGQEQVCLNTLHAALLATTASHSDVIKSGTGDVYTAKYVKKTEHKKEEKLVVETQEVLLQIRAFKLESEGPTLLTVFRHCEEGDRDVSKEFLAHIDPIHAFCEPYHFVLKAGELELDSEDEYDNESDYDEELAEAGLQQHIEAENARIQNNLGEN